GCMRMRRLGHGHSVVFLRLQKYRSIWDVNNRGYAEDIHVSDILVWAMIETCADIRRHAPQWLA
ncbi:hypothetical protein DEU56DRAFT_748383, partial [Suillus clintonianus]|uniref:uncharacterized protein n=1 Tax=Suillus clintonianus TaxID=1904413 RepID=UPI001B865FB3